ncbi:MAG: hypothetical protein L3K14_04135 [Thermoplasmata archaeon]|nr:hypothetical protein [Thermoplasmata archaeon]
MATKKLGRPLVALLLVEAVLFVVSLPGFGIETRKFTDYAMWAGPVFLGLTILIFAGVLAAVATARRMSDWTARLALIVAAAAVAIVLFDLSAVAGPPDPPGPLALSAVVLVVSALILYCAWRDMQSAPETPA